MFEHKDADRVPVFDEPWSTTIERWVQEGMPTDVDYVDYFSLDKIVTFGVDNSPRYEEKVLEETEQYKVFTTRWGATIRNWKHAESTPEYLDFIVKSSDDWIETKKRMTPSADRIPIEYLKVNYPKWRKQGAWIQVYGWFGFDVTHSHVVGTERFLMAMVEKPDWCVEMFNHFLDVNIAIFDMAWNAGFEFDAIKWPDDMGYKQNQFFSLKMYSELLKPIHKRAIDWAHAKGIKTLLHSCGDINPFILELIDIGLDGLNPLEVKAGMNPVEIKRKYGKKLLLNGGMNAVLWDERDAMEVQMREIMPVMKKDGGYIFSSDHSVPSNVCLEDFRYIVDLAKELGKY